MKKKHATKKSKTLSEPLLEEEQIAVEHEVPQIEPVYEQGPSESDPVINEHQSNVPHEPESSEQLNEQHESSEPVHEPEIVSATNTTAAIFESLTNADNHENNYIINQINEGNAALDVTETENTSSSHVTGKRRLASAEQDKRSSRIKKTPAKRTGFLINFIVYMPIQF